MKLFILWSKQMKKLYLILVPNMFPKPPVLQKRVLTAQQWARRKFHTSELRLLQFSKTGQHFSLPSIMWVVLGCWKLSPKSTFSLRMLVVCKARRKLNGWRNPLKPGSMKTKTLSLMRYDKILTLILGGKVLDNLTLILTGGGVLGRHHWGRIPVADWWWVLERGEYYIIWL